LPLLTSQSESSAFVAVLNADGDGIGEQTVATLQDAIAQHGLLVFRGLGKLPCQATCGSRQSSQRPALKVASPLVCHASRAIHA
jgi:hypothetical protein